MIRIPPFRRMLLTEPDGCESVALARCSSRLIGMACYKGNASEQQSSTQTGAQSQGVAVNGSSNTSNTGNQIIIGANAGSGGTYRSRRGDLPPSMGATAATAAGSSVNATINNGVSSQDIASAINALAGAIVPAQPGNPADATKKLEAPTAGTATGGQATWQMAAAIIGVVGGLILIFRKKST